MSQRRPARSEISEVARRRLELLHAELAKARPDPPEPPPAQPPPPEQPSPPEQTREPGPGPGPLTVPGRHARRAAGGRFTRVSLEGGHLTVVAVLVAVAAVLGAWWVLRAAGSEPVEVRTQSAHPVSATRAAALVVPAATPSISGTGPVGDGAPAGQVVVDVAGKVRHPGIVTLPSGSRVVDALHEAGGPRRHVDLSSLNLARVLVDGEQIVVGQPVPAGAAASALSTPGAAAGVLVNINTADTTALDTLPGVGPVTAASIIDWRTENGSFSSVDELLEVSGIGDATLADLAPYVTV